MLKNLSIFTLIIVASVSFLFVGCETTGPKVTKTNSLSQHEDFRWSRQKFLNPPLSEIKEKSIQYKAKNGQKITHAFFGYYDEKKDGQVEFVATNKIPYQVGLSYGWFFKVEGKQVRKSELTEEFQLPEPPRILRFNIESTKISNDGAKVTTTLPFKEKNGWINNSWMITPEDPKGPYSITVLEKEKAIHTFEFEIVK